MSVRRFSLIMGLIALTGSAVAAPPSPKPAAVVNGTPISRADWENALKRLPPPPPALTEEQRKAAHMEVLGMLIDDLLLRQYLAKQVPAPDPAAVRQRVAELEASLKSRKLTLQD